jgi:DNA recombination protein RmuC
MGMTAVVAVLVLAAVLLAVFLRRPPPADPRLDAVIAAQGRIDGQFQQTVAAQTELQRLLSERLDALNKRLGDSLAEGAAKTAETLTGLGERLGAIDAAQKNIVTLSGQVVSLQEVLANKQARGAFGQGRMEDIVRDALPASLYEFQAKLSNGSRPDCVIRIPGSQLKLVIDAKFPLESFEAVRRAVSEEEKKAAAARVRADVSKHIGDISGKYLIPGETQSPALMFIPSESLYADLYDGFGDVIQKAYHANVVVVSPSILMLAVSTIQTVMRNAKMREQADLIQKEVRLLVGDVNRLGDRVKKLQSHFLQAEEDVRTIVVSTEKIGSHGEKIAKVELSETAAPSLPAP